MPAPQRRRLAAVLTLTALALVSCDEPPGIDDDDPLPEHGAITAVVTTGSGEGVEDAGVLVYETGASISLTSARTAPNGRVTLEGLAPGDYMVRVTPPPGLAGGGTATVAVAAGIATTVNFTVWPDEEAAQTGAFHVRVLVDSISPYEGARVYLFRGGDHVAPLRFGSSDAQGWVYFLDLSPFGYAVELDVPAGYEMIPPRIPEGFGNVTAGNTTQFVFHIQEES